MLDSSVRDSTERSATPWKEALAFVPMFFWDLGIIMVDVTTHQDLMKQGSDEDMVDSDEKRCRACEPVAKVS